MKHTALIVALGLSFGLAPAASAHHGGECYISENNTHICYVEVFKGHFAAAITDGTSPKPTVVAFHCPHKWKGAGSLSKEQMQAVAAAICQQRTGSGEALVAIR